MCGRYRRTTQEEELARLYHIPIPKQTDLPISYNIVPSQKVLTIRFNPETRQRSAALSPSAACEDRTLPAAARFPSPPARYFPAVCAGHGMIGTALMLFFGDPSTSRSL